jgi:ribosomal-protein-serine acetyltransferase
VSRPFLDLGDDLELRFLETGDADALFELVDADRERLRARMPWVDGTTTPTDTRTFIESGGSGGSGENLDAIGLYVLGTLVGTIGARPDVMHGDCEVGYWISSEYEGRGLMTRACTALVGHLLATPDCHRVTIRAAPDNERSRAIPERLGFTEEGIMREAGWTPVAGYHDLVVYGLLEHKWEAAS